MIIGASLKLVFAVVAGLVGTFGGFLPYVRDIFRNKTKPHAYTWLIWSMTQGTALVGVWKGNGGWWAVAAMGIAVISNVTVFFLSLKYGTRNITRGDTVIFLAALLAIFIWWQLHNPIVALVMIIVIDFAGYFPSFRKTYEEPWTETAVAWAAFSAATILTILALREYNFLSVTYLSMTCMANTALLTICLVRRRLLAKPVTV